MATIYGDPQGPTPPHILSDKQKGGDQDNLTGNQGQDNTIYGDVDLIKDRAEGGNDSLTGGTLWGDESSITNWLYGDAQSMSDKAQGGDDTLTGGDAQGCYECPVTNIGYGDAATMSDNTKGGDDTLIGGWGLGDGPVTNVFYGDAETMSDKAQGGDDTLIGGGAFNQLFGDAATMSDNTKGGDDRLISTVENTDFMWGDAEDMSESAKGGSDTFVFIDRFLFDFVYDFDQAERDKIEFQVEGVEDFDDLTIAFDGTDTVITTSASVIDSVTLVDYDNEANPLMQNDFDFIIV